MIHDCPHENRKLRTSTRRYQVWLSIDKRNRGKIAFKLHLIAQRTSQSIPSNLDWESSLKPEWHQNQKSNFQTFKWKSLPCPKRPLDLTISRIWTEKSDRSGVGGGGGAADHSASPISLPSWRIFNTNRQGKPKSQYMAIEQGIFEQKTCQLCGDWQNADVRVLNWGKPSEDNEEMLN